MFDVTFQRTHTERASDGSRQFMYNRTPEHEDRIVDHCKRVQREYFDSGLHYAEMHSAEGGGINGA